MDNTRVESTFVRELLDEIESMDPEIFHPPGEVEKGEIVIGECSLYVRKLHAVCTYYAREFERLNVEVKYTVGPEDREKLTILLQIYKAKNGIAHNLAYSSIREELKVWELDSVGIRRGWKVVDTSSITGKVPKALRQLFGMEE